MLPRASAKFLACPHIGQKKRLSHDILRQRAVAFHIFLGPQCASRTGKVSAVHFHFLLVANYLNWMTVTACAMATWDKVKADHHAEINRQMTLWGGRRSHSTSVLVNYVHQALEGERLVFTSVKTNASHTLHSTSFSVHNVHQELERCLLFTSICCLLQIIRTEWQWQSAQNETRSRLITMQKSIWPCQVLHTWRKNLQSAGLWQAVPCHLRSFVWSLLTKTNLGHILKST